MSSSTTMTTESWYVVTNPAADGTAAGYPDVPGDEVDELEELADESRTARESAAAEDPAELREKLPAHLRDVGRLPGRALWITEPLRAAGDATLLAAATPWLAAAKNGDGHGVLVLPGLLAGDGSTKPLRAYVRRRGYRVRGWRLGRNIGPSANVLEGLPGGLRDLAELTKGPVSIIGWSMGGIYARQLAAEHPQYVRQVITLGSPFGVAHGHRTRADAMINRLSLLHARPAQVPQREELPRELPVPSTSIYSKLDGIVGWRSCLGEATDLHQNIEVRCSHLGFGFDPATMWAVADRLSQPADRWESFDPPRALRLFYGRVS